MNIVTCRNAVKLSGLVRLQMKIFANETGLGEVYTEWK